MENEFVRAALEALIYAAEEPIATAELEQVLKDVPAEQVHAALEQLREQTNGGLRGLRLIEIAGGWRFETRPEYGPYIEILYHDKLRRSLSRAALETLALIAYRQPVTLPEISEARGVDCGAVIRGLLERRLVRIAGRREAVGRPLLYATTKEFLLYFGLNDLTDLPTLEEFHKLAAEREPTPNPLRPEPDGQDAVDSGATPTRAAEPEPPAG
jgi:segregation and condensation protein B